MNNGTSSNTNATKVRPTISKSKASGASAPLRNHADGTPMDDDSDPEDVSTLFASLSAKLLAEVGASNERLKAEVVASNAQLATTTSGHVETLVTAYAKTVNKRFNSVEADVADLRASSSDLKQGQEDIRKELADLRRELAVPESSTPNRPWTDDKKFDRPVRDNVISINTGTTQVSLQAISKMVDDWLKELTIEPKHYSLNGGGSPLSKFWRLTFKGESGLASRRAHMAIDALRNDEGKWTELFVDAGGSSVRAYAGPDKNPKMLATERLTKKLLEVCNASHAGLNCQMLKRDGIITTNAQKLILLTPNADKTYDLKWDNSLVAELDINKKTITDAFDVLAKAAATDNTMWAP